ncbi:MAG: glycosyltransferase family 39 protein [Actinomycetia bacterium]|nr:glycosyltransferase family 39 protein [Actinomycetes bacterium]
MVRALRLPGRNRAGHGWSAPARRRASLGTAGAAVLLAAPDLVAAMVAGFALPSMVLLLADQFRPALVLPFGIAGALLAAVLVGVPRVAIDRREALLAAVAVAVVVAWFAMNIFFSAQNLYAHRDPATYNLAARWLVSNPSLHIPIHAEVFGDPVAQDAGSAGFGGAGPGLLYAQGNHLLPVLLAPIGWLFGVRAMLAGNVAIGALALLVFFGLARRVVGAAFALVALCALAVSVPMLFVSRDTYSEPVTMLLLLGGLSLLHRAIRGRRTADFALAGFVAGAAATARIDVYLALAALVLAAAVLLAVAPVGDRRRVGRQVTALLAPAAAMSVLGWLDVTWLSYGYYRDERHHIVSTWYAVLASAVVGAVVLWVAWRPRWRARFAAPRLWRVASRAVVALIVVFAALLASRPLWMRHLRIHGVPAYNANTLNWQAVYFGWPMLVLATVGYVLLARRLIRDRQYPLVGVLFMGAAMSAMYLTAAQITPDQPWASRRYLPVVVPALLIAATAALGALWRIGRRQASARAGLDEWLRAVRPWARGLTALGVVALLVPPALSTAPVAGIREEAPQLDQVLAICRAVGPSGAVLMLDRPAKTSYQQTIRSYCEVPVIGLVNPSRPELASARAAAFGHGRTLYGLSTTPDPILAVSGFGTAVAFSTVDTMRWPGVMNAAPRVAAMEKVTVYLVRVGSDGQLAPVG